MVMPSSTEHWQPGALEAHADSAVAYLDRVSATPWLRKVAECSVEACRLSPGQSVLEIGCGSGVFLPRLAAVVGPLGKVFGIDAAPALVDTARRRMAATTWVTVERADAYHLPYADNTFDVVHCERVLIHLDHPRRALREMARVVKPDGRIVAAEPDWGGLQLAASDPAAATTLLQGWLRGLAQPRLGLELYGYFAEAGFVDVAATPVATDLTDFAEVVGYGVNLEHAAAELEASGVMNLARSRAVLAEWSDASAAHRFFGYLAMIVVAGRVPR